MDDYLAGLAGEQQEALRRVRAVVERVAPDAEEGVSYGMPAYLYAGRPLLGLRAAKKHLSVFPFSPAAVEAVQPAARGRPRGSGRGPAGGDRREAVTAGPVTGRATARRTS
jgi:uncharacterized protein YdhG (YjbR/CyaY superfamily)